MLLRAVTSVAASAAVPLLFGTIAGFAWACAHLQHPPDRLSVFGIPSLVYYLHSSLP
jgi:hypothetical protein